ncbi:3'-5' exoribonuclease 1 [Sparganum proliferum]
MAAHTEDGRLRCTARRSQICVFPDSGVVPSEPSGDAFLPSCSIGPLAAPHCSCGLPAACPVTDLQLLRVQLPAPVIFPSPGLSPLACRSFWTQTDVRPEASPNKAYLPGCHNLSLTSTSAATTASFQPLLSPEALAARQQHRWVVCGDSGSAEAVSTVATSPGFTTLVTDSTIPPISRAQLVNVPRTCYTVASNPRLNPNSLQQQHQQLLSFVGPPTGVGELALQNLPPPPLSPRMIHDHPPPLSHLTTGAAPLLSAVATSATGVVATDVRNSTLNGLVTDSISGYSPLPSLRKLPNPTTTTLRVPLSFMGLPPTQPSNPANSPCSSSSPHLVHPQYHPPTSLPFYSLAQQQPSPMTSSAGGEVYDSLCALDPVLYSTTASGQPYEDIRSQYALDYSLAYDGLPGSEPEESCLLSNAPVTSIASSSTLVDGVSSFIRTSFTDVPLGALEEVLSRLSVNDNYFGPLKLSRRSKADEEQKAESEPGGAAGDGDAVFSPSSEPPRSPTTQVTESSPREDPYRLLPYSHSSLAFIPPGVMVVTEVWEFFASERLSFCNHQISCMKFEQLKRCLHKHSLNQRGSTLILKRRLQEFVRRLRESPACRTNPASTDEGDLAHITAEASFPPLEGTPVETSCTAVTNTTEEEEEDAADIRIPPDDFRMIKLRQPVVLTPDVFYAYLLIIDLEATCDGKPREIGGPDFPHEIIEFPVLLYDTRQRKCVSVFHSYCRPKLRPNLSTFCKTLTQISQTQVDNAVTFPTLLAQLENWLLVQNNLSEQRCAIVCDCSADMAKFMRMQCQLSRIPMPPWARMWINLSKAFRQFYRLQPRHRSTLSTMLDDLELSFAGQQHRGLDDAMNILRVVQILLADGCRLRVNERIDPGRPPSYTTSVPRLVAESACGVMGSKLALLEKRSKSASYYTQPGGGPPTQAPLTETLTETDRDSLLWLHAIQKKRVSRPNVP